MGSLSIWHWLIVLVVVIVIFGTKRLKNVGQDLGEAIKGFKKGMQDGEADDDDQRSKRPPEQLSDGNHRDQVGGDAPGDAHTHPRDTQRDAERDPPAKR